MSTFTNDCRPVAGRRIGNGRLRYSRAYPLSKAAGKLFAERQVELRRAFGTSLVLTIDNRLLYSLVQHTKVLW